MHLSSLPRNRSGYQAALGARPCTALNVSRSLDVGDPEIKCSMNLTHCGPHPYKGTLLSTKEGGTTGTFNNTAELQMHYATGKKPDLRAL